MGYLLRFFGRNDDPRADGEPVIRESSENPLIAPLENPPETEANAWKLPAVLLKLEGGDSKRSVTYLDLGMMSDILCSLPEKLACSVRIHEISR